LEDNVNLVSVGLGEIKVSDDPGTVLVAYGLGSCLGLTAYDPVVRIGGLAHMVLPYPNGTAHSSPGRYVAEAVPALLNAMGESGSLGRRLQFKVAGGAQMFTFDGGNESLEIGRRNIEALREITSDLGMRINASDLGGNCGRTMKLQIATGLVIVSTAGSSEQSF